MNGYMQTLMDKWEDKSNQNRIAYRVRLFNAVSYGLMGKYNDSILLVSELNRQNPIEIRIALSLIWLKIKLERYDEAYKSLKALLKYKKYYHDTDKTILAILYYFKALIDYYKGRHMFVQRSLKIFDDCLEEENSGILFFIKAMIEREFFNEEKTQAYYYDKAFLNGLRSPFLYSEVYRLLCLDFTYFYNMKDMVRAVFIWAIKYEVLDKENAKLFISWANQNQESLNIPKDYIEKMYNRWGISEALVLLCATYIKENKRDKEAFKVFEAIIDLKFYVKGVHLAYIETAHKLDMVKIPTSILQSAMLKEQFNESLTAYIYSILCKDEQHRMLFQIHYNKILAFGENALRANKQGKYYIDIYMRLLEKNENDNLFKKAIFEQLFTYEVYVESPLIKYIWVIESEKETTATYIVDKKILYIEAVAHEKDELTILCIGQRQKGIYPKDLIRVNKLVKDVPVDLLLKYYDEGYRSASLLIRLTKYFINEMPKNMGNLSLIKAVRIMGECLENSALSDTFRKKISASLGTLYSFNKEQEKAFPYFKPLDLQDLYPYQIEYGINALIEGGDVTKAIFWAQGSDSLGDDTKFKLVKKGIELNIENSYIAGIAYNLILERKYDEVILDYVLKNYKGSMGEWYALRHMIKLLEKPTYDIDKKILQKGIWIRDLNEELEEAFQNIYEKEPTMANDFILYCSYEILINGKMVTPKTLEKLEKNFELTQDMLLGSSLIHIYANIPMNIEIKNETILPIFKWMKRNQFIFPIIKEKQDKFPYFSYVEQNTPFTHYTKKGKEVYFCYKIQGFPLNKKKMYPIAFGLYGICVSLFFNESMEYYIEEIDKEDNIILTEVKMYNHNCKKLRGNPKEVYEKLNNASIYSHDLEFDKVESILDEMICENQKNNVGWLL
ncbi:MAG: hypothetical protein GX308_09975 [Epulopiscium sp.]|nr:hypothetical protein [Candidatus Epulonipiscium sp.]